MCNPSAISANEPNSAPPCRDPRPETRGRAAETERSILRWSCRPSLEIGVDHFDELVRRVGVKGARILLGIDEMGADVILNHFGHQACDTTANARDHMHDALAFGLFGQRDRKSVV